MSMQATHNAPAGRPATAEQGSKDGRGRPVRFWLPAILILLAALLLRGAGLGGDLPLVYHPDTSKQVKYVERQAVKGEFPILKDGYPVGHMQVVTLLVAAADRAGRWMGLTPQWTGPDLHVWARCCGLAFGLLGLLFTMLAGRLFFGPGVGLLAGLLLCLDELYIIHSHYAMGDIPQAAMVMGALYFCGRIVKYNRIPDTIWAGLCVGLAAGIKYFGGFMALGVLAAHLLARRKRPALLGLGLIFAAAGFALVTPYLLKDFSAWFWELRLEFFRQSKLSLLKQADIAPWVWYGLSHSLAIWIQRSIIIPYLAPLGLAAMFWKRTRMDWLLIIAALLDLFIVAVMRSTYLRDWDHLAAAPMLCLLTARGAQIAWIALGEWARSRGWTKGPRGAWPQAALAACLGLLLAGQAWFSLEDSYLFTLPDTRRQVEWWLAEHLPPALPGQVLMADRGCSSSVPEVDSADVYYPQNLGYSLLMIPSRYTDQWMEELRRPKAGPIAYAVLHGFPYSETMKQVDRWNPPVKQFKMPALGWHGPFIEVYEIYSHVLRTPWRPLSPLPIWWQEADSANTPYALRQARQLVMRAGVQKRLLISQRPLGRIGLLVQGGGRLRVTQGGHQATLEASPKHAKVITWHAERGWPYEGYFYHFRLEADKGAHLMVALLLSPAELAAGLARAGDYTWARQLWRRAEKNGDAILPQDRLAWASLLWRAGDREGARREAAVLDRERPEFRKGVLQAGDLADRDPEAALKALARGLGATPRDLAWRELTTPMAQAGRTVGWPQYDPELKSQVLALPAGRPGWTKLWIEKSLASPWVRVRFWIKAAAGPKEKLAVVDVFGHHAFQGRGVLAAAPVETAGGPGYFPVDLRVRLPMIPMRLEARVRSLGKRDLWASRIEIKPDPAAWAKSELASLPGVRESFR